MYRSFSFHLSFGKYKMILHQIMDTIFCGLMQDIVVLHLISLTVCVFTNLFYYSLKTLSKRCRTLDPHCETGELAETWNKRKLLERYIKFFFLLKENNIIPLFTKPYSIYITCENHSKISCIHNGMLFS